MVTTSDAMVALEELRRRNGQNMFEVARKTVELILRNIVNAGAVVILTLGAVGVEMTANTTLLAAGESLHEIGGTTRAELMTVPQTMLEAPGASEREGEVLFWSEIGATFMTTLPLMFTG